MKKLLSILLVFMLVFGMVACGSDETPEGDGTGTENGVVDGSGEEPGSEGGVDGEDGSSEGSAGGAGTVLNPDDLVMGEDGSMEAEYDLKFDAASGFGLDSVVEQVSYRDISSLTTTMEDRLAVADSVFGTTFSAFSEYEEIEEDEIDKLAYAIAMENDDTEATFLEAGAYHSRSTDKHYQYVVMATRNFYEVSDANTAEVVDTLEKAMGISISKKRMKKAINEAFEKATETEDYFSLLDSDTAKGSGYTETIKVSVDAFATEEGEIGYYVSCERERCYE